MVWFEKVFGFKEQDFDSNRNVYSYDPTTMELRKNDKTKTFNIGRFDFMSPADIQKQLGPIFSTKDEITFTSIQGDAHKLHFMPENKGAVIQAASQTNCLEMASPLQTPSDGIMNYINDRTQGPACALACPGGTFFRNYFLPGGFGTDEWKKAEKQQRIKKEEFVGQKDAQVNLFQKVEKFLYENSGKAYFTQTNGYAFASSPQLKELNTIIADPEIAKTLFDLFQVGVHWEIDVYNDNGTKMENQHVCQVYCSACPVAYSGISASEWAPISKIALDSLYDATIGAAALLSKTNATYIKKRQKVLLTLVGGGVFGNDPEWIRNAIVKAVVKYRQFPLDIELVFYGPIDLLYENAVKLALNPKVNVVKTIAVNDPIARFLNSEIVADFIAFQSLNAKKDKQADTLFFGINGTEKKNQRLYPFPFIAVKTGNIHAAFYNDESVEERFKEDIKLGALGGPDDILNIYPSNSIKAILIDWGVLNFMDEDRRKETINSMWRVLKIQGCIYFPDLRLSNGTYANNEAITAETRLESYKNIFFSGDDRFEFSLMQDPINPAAKIMQKWVMDRASFGEIKQGEQVIVVKKIK